MHWFRKSPKIPEFTNFFDLSGYSKFYFPTTTSSFFSLKNSIKNTALVGEYSSKESLLLFLESVFCFSENSKKIVLILFFFIYQNYRLQLPKNFTKTTGFICSIIVGIENILSGEIFPMGELSICVPCFSVLTVRTFQ